MDRYKNCHVYLDKKKIIRYVVFKYHSVSAYCRINKISRVRFYEILNCPHCNSDADCIKNLAKNIGLKIEDLILVIY